MITPKTFYQELDSILAKIGTVEKDGNFLFTILKELEQKFGDMLKIHNSHIYELRGHEYVLISQSEPKKMKSRLEETDQVVQLVNTHGSYIYDNPELGNRFQLKNDLDYIIPAAIHVHSTDWKWIFVFELSSGWLREEVILFLNSIRTAFNYRLFSEQINGELKQAARIQRSLLPTESPSVEGYDIYGRSTSAEMVGGDIYEYFQFDDENFGVSIGDASGHGLPAALLVRDVVIGLRMGLAKEMRLVHTVKKLNQVIQKSTYSTNFVSLFIGEIESGDHFFYVNAGHPAPFLIAGKKVHDLEATGIALGFLPDISLHRSYIRFDSPSVLVMYTDGISERENDQEEQFGVDRLKKLVIKNQNKSSKEIVQMVFDAVFKFGKRAPWDDDASMVVIKKL